jgi:signal transduction histidine kinase
MESKSIVSKNIEITISKDQDSFWIDYRDSGPGIEPDLIRRNIIFEPHFSTKPEGTGLGLSIAGEAVSRFGMTIKALESDMGAYFRIEQKEI